MTSALFQTLLGPRDLRMFRTPSTQPEFNPKNCGAVTGQLLGLVTPRKAEEMTEQTQGVMIAEWIDFAKNVLHMDIGYQLHSIDTFTTIFQSQLFHGFGTLVLAIGKGETFGHYFVVAKSKDGQLAIVDPQLRKGFFNLSEYFSLIKPTPSSFYVLIRDTPKTSAQHESDYIDGFLANNLSQCLTDMDRDMDVDVEVSQPKDVEMKGGKKRRKTKRRLIANRTLRRMHRRR